MKSRGFSLIEVMIVGSVLIGLALGVNTLISNLSKTEGDLEQRRRYHDLVDDARFLFSHPVLCEEAMASLAQSNSLALNPRLVLSAGAPVPEYGVRITGLSLVNSAAPVARSKILTDVNGRPKGYYQETCRVAEVFVTASLLGSEHVLKTEKIARVISVSRSGALNDGTCSRIEEREGCTN
ncbi:MAG: type IV pilus modification PilV family protein [Bdellovibrionota bacterium]